MSEWSQDAGVEHPRERDEWACTALPLACAVRVGETVTTATLRRGRFRTKNAHNVPPRAVVSDAYHARRFKGRGASCCRNMRRGEGHQRPWPVRCLKSRPFL